MASKAALVVLALAAGTATAGTPINAEKYSAVGEVGACRGNGGAELGDKINQKQKQGLTQAECETECDDIATCLGYAYEHGAASTTVAYCIIYGPEVAGTCSNTFQDTIEKCAAVGQCSDTSVDACGLAEGDDCLAEMEACKNMGATWTSASAVWTNPEDGWEGGAGRSYSTTHIDGANGNSEYTCYDIDLNDHEATCINGPTHDGYTIHGNAVGYNSGCADTWTDTYYANCANIAGCPAQTCGGDAVAVADTPHAYCCEDSDCSGAWHYCGCQRDFEAGGKVESACDVAAGCVYTAAPVMETAATVNPGDALGCSSVYTPMLGACRGTDPTTGAQVGVNAKGARGCDIDGKQKACGDTGQPTCEMTQEECEAGCAAENAIAPGRCEAYHWAPGGWCTIHGPHVHEGIGWEANPTCVEPASAGPGTCESAFTAASGTAEADCNTAGGCVYSKGAAAADSCWSYWSSGYTEVTGTNTNIEYMCFMLIDTTVNNVCGNLASDGAAAQTLAFGAALAAGLLA